MKESFSINLIVLAITLFLISMFSTPAHSQDIATRIAFVNAEKIFTESNMAKVAQSRLQNEFAKRQNEIRDGAQKIKATAEKLDRDAAVMPEAERIRKQRELADFDRDLQRKNRELNDDAAQRNVEERAKIAEKASIALRQIAEQRKIDIIFQEPPAYLNPRLDITDDVIKVLNNLK
jgi:outer membrane protein